jgi:hypothetical protein
MIRRGRVSNAFYVWLSKGSGPGRAFERRQVSTAPTDIMKHLPSIIQALVNDLVKKYKEADLYMYGSTEESWFPCYYEIGRS